MKKEFTISLLISFAFLSIGFLLLHYQLIGYGISFFVFLPFILGFILGNSIVKKYSLIGLLFSLFIFFILLFVGGLEGMVCILMTLPLIIGAICIGILLKQIISKYQNKKSSENLIKSSIVPFLMFLTFGFIEKELTKNNKEIISVKTEMILQFSTLEVYDAIKSIDTLKGEKPFLMKLDLPIPNKCILEKEVVGGKRICYFSGGTITEKITELEKGRVLKMDVIDYKLTGRKWLGFKEAIYHFDKIGENHCKITRITTYTSELTPRFYWAPLEKIGINQEHDYVFNNLKNKLINK